MSRGLRIKLEKKTVYHVCSRSRGVRGEFPLQTDINRQRLVDLMKFYASAYQCDVLGYCVMGNHYHLIVQMHEYKKRSKKSLMDIALKLYPRCAQLIKEKWVDSDWERFNRRIYNLSEFMASLNRSFTRWYNYTYDCRGGFWADRFKSNILSDTKAVRECLMYVDLNPVRAGIIEQPEKYVWSSCYLRIVGQDDWLYDLSKIFQSKNKEECLKVYLSHLYHRGAIKLKSADPLSEKNKGFIPGDVYEKMIKRDFRPEGVYLEKFRYFSDGLIMGKKEKIENLLTLIKEKSKGVFYSHRKNAIPQENGDFTLREQRSNAKP